MGEVNIISKNKSIKNTNIAIMLFSIFILNLVDYIFTVRAIGMGFEEANPVINALLHAPLFPIVKIGLVTLGLVLIWQFRHRTIRIKKLILALLTITFLAYGAVSIYHIYGLGYL